MTKQSEFTEEEWRYIVSGPPMVGVAVAAASLSGPIGMMKEMLALGMALGQVAERGSPNALITAVVKDLKERTTAPQAPPELLSAPHVAKEHALSHLGEVSQILYRKVSDAEAEEFKRWLVTLGERVAEAAKEGGVLGFGGELVSDEERSALRQIAFALGLPATTTSRT
ncbi:MAG: hypothetical protein ACREU9_11405 [Gammaproteobacteria bacterium]